MKPLKALLIAQDVSSHTHLKHSLQKRGYQCWVEGSADRALASFGRHGFHLVLDLNPSSRPTLPQVCELGAANGAVFWCFPVEIGCWWLPIVLGGKQCFGSAAVRQSEFAEILESMARQTRVDPESSQDESRTILSTAD